MSDGDEFQDEQLPLEGVGQMLRRAREKAQMSIAQIAAQTRIPQRHLELIEAGDFGALPARTYAIGFSRSYAKVVGLDDKVIANKLREELAEYGHDEDRRGTGYNPADPARTPSRGLAWLTGLAAVLLIVGGFAYFRDFFIPGAGPGPLVADMPVPAKEPSPAAAAGAGQGTAATSGPVVFTSLEQGVWVKFYDGSGKRLFEKQMDKGEAFTVPADAANPQIWTGRPDALAITIGGRPVAKLAEAEGVIKDVPISATALAARPAAPLPSPVPTAIEAPVPAG